jgi:hypothetical protein
MTQDEMMQAREIRRFLEKRAIDATLAIVSVNKGYVTVSGTIREARSAVFTSIEDELNLFTTMVMRNVRDVRSVVIDARVKIAPKKEKEHIGEPSSPHLPGHGAGPGSGSKSTLPGHH